ncbi:MAG TPA: hypothetical protein VH157_07015 [Bryobacteraceae bacterium]|jgi:hypothetical protein|nr:hypothetical protein [Bryobacteraceae bacterium]
MALTYEESAALMTDGAFRGRIKVACLKFADSILIQSAPVANRTAQVRWATQMFQQPDTIAAQVQPPTVMDGAVQIAGAAITDAALQGSVEATVQKMF